MKLTPGQVAELRGDKNVRGGLPDRDGGMAVVFQVAISYSAFERVQVLAHAGALPRDVTWYVHATNPNRVELYTTRPEWFVELEEMIDAARRNQPR